MIARKKAPYSDTKVPAEQTRAEIDKLLRSYGVQDFQWTELWSKGVVKLRFMLERGPNEGYIAIEVSPPPFVAKRKSWDSKRGYVTVEAPNWPQSMRCLLHWLKAKLEAVAFGLKSVEEEFLSDLVVRDRDGVEHTAGPMILKALAEGNGQLALEAPKAKDRSGAISVEGELVR